MLPLEIFVIKALGWVHAVYFTATARREAKAWMRSSAVVDSSTGSRRALAVYRAMMLGWALSIGINQLQNKGPVIFAFFTVWNWWLLTLFFALATLASLRALFLERPGRPGPVDRPADWLERAAAVVFAMEAPTCLMVDLMTWTVLVPMLMASPDPARVKHWQAMMYSWESYNQHGFNAVMMMGELLLGRIPLTFAHSGYVSMLASIYGVHSTVFFWKNGHFIYPFLDAHKPYAWMGYIGMIIVMTAAFMLVLGLTRARDWLVQRQAAAKIKAC